jgi:hypothetical protein
MYAGRELTAEWCDFAGIEIARTHNRHPSCPPYGESDATEERRQNVREGFADLVARSNPAAARFLDKNPHLWNKLPFLKKIFPDATIVITSRDIRSTVASMKLLWEKQNKESGKRYFFPGESRSCWGVLSSVPSAGEDAPRIFPGGSVAALAEYWLNVYETIEQTASRFASCVSIKHRDFIVDPQGSLAKVHAGGGLRLSRRPLPESIDPSRNTRWPDILTAREQIELEAFLAIHSPRIKQLRYADTTF